MIRHDYLCTSCGHTEEVVFDDFSQFQKEIPCSCGGRAVQVWLQAPGLAGVSEPGSRGIDRTFTPGYDIQSGRIFADRADRDKYLRERKLIALGPEEYKRSVNSSHSEPEPDYSGLVPAMKEAYAENEAGKITPHLIVDSKTINPVIAKE